MIIDLILDRKFDDKLQAEGYSHIKTTNGELVELKYDAKRFYNNVLGYVEGCAGYYADRITWAMDYGTEELVKRELCAYIIENEYNPSICQYVNSVSWLQ